MKKTFLFTLLFCSIISFGQIRSVSTKVQELSSQKEFKSYDLFSVDNNVYKATKYFTSATDVTVLNLDETQLQRLLTEAPEYIEVTIPYYNEMVEVELFKQNIFTESFIAKDEQGNLLDFALGEYYRGAIKGDHESLAAISFFEGDVMGVISSYEHGNITVGRSADRQDFISYSDKNLLGQNPFECGVDDMAFDHTPVEFNPEMMSTTMTENCVKIYYEIAYRPYQMNSYNVQNTINWITGIHNNIATLYANDNINIALHELKIWTSNDPYDGSYGENLEQFKNTVTEFNGDLAHLVNNPSTTSVAYMNSLCTDWRYAYSGINMSYSQVPTYSWTIMAMTHEMGHSLGSPHTHACAWNGNNTAIDGCGPAAGFGEGCNAPLPTNGGTIMSYCHLTSAGINFLNGFGDQPGALIRSTVDSKPCLGTDCSCQSTIQDLGITYLDGGQIQVQITDDASSEWQYKVYPYGATNTGDWQTTTDQDFVLSGLSPNMYYELLVTNLCGDLEGGLKKEIILTGDFCDGTLFTDTGGSGGTYQNNQHFTKTFYPATSSHKVSLNFTRIGLQTEQDFMYVYNGDSTDAPLFDGGTITGNNNPGPSFTSTHSTGAITIEFVSNGSGTAYGWEAVVDCEAVLSVEDITIANGVMVYPNPASSVLNIDAKTEILSVRINDASGKLVLNRNTQSVKESVNVAHLPQGVYILTVELKGKTVTKKIIKK